MRRPIQGHLTISAARVIARHVSEALLRRDVAREEERLKHEVQVGNVFVRGGGLDFVKDGFANLAAGFTTVVMHLWPWRLPSSFDGQSLATRCGPIVGSGTNGSKTWPVTNPTLDANADLARLRGYSNALTLLSTDPARVIGAVCANGGQNGTGATALPSAIAFSDVATTQISPSYVHPSFAGTANTTINQSYLTTVACAVAGITYDLHAMPSSRGSNYVKITTGADAGVYRVRQYDKAASRLYLECLDGSVFTASATATGVGVIIGPGLAFFNQTSIIPNSTGTVTFDGVFAPGENRASYLFRVHFEKTGSPSPSDASRTGTYWFQIRPYTYGEGDESNTEPGYRDCAGLGYGMIFLDGDVITLATLPSGVTGPSAGYAGGCPGLFLDRTNQRLWHLADDATNSAIAWWLYKSPESIHEVANNAGTTPNDPISGITMTSARARSLDYDEDRNVYIALYAGANAGIVKITPSLVASQWLTSASTLGTNLRAVRVDRSRARTTAAGTVSTAAGTGKQTVTVTGGAFTAADVGRLITLSGGTADNGTYRIAGFTSATQVTVEVPVAGTAPNGGTNVTFTGTTNSGAMRIGSRIYLGFNDTTSHAGGLATQVDLRYMETLTFGASGIFRTGNLTVTSGTARQLYDGGRVGDEPPMAVDPSNGNLYWVSTDTATNVNRFDVTANTVSQKAISTFTTPGGGAGTISTPTLVNHLAVNTHASFREVWMATDFGFVRFTADLAMGSIKSTWTAGLSSEAALADGTYQRYYGQTNTDYSNTNGTSPGLRPDGGAVNATTNRAVRRLGFGLDGRVYGYMSAATATAAFDWVYYVREHDAFTMGMHNTTNMNPNGTVGVTGFTVTPYGEIVSVYPQDKGSVQPFRVWSIPTDYQWIAAAWTAKEVMRGALPDATSSPGLSAKDLHTAYADLIYGVKVKFTPQGGATPDNNEFLGRMGQNAPQRADGAVGLASSTFTGSGFSAADVGRYLRIESVGGDTVNAADVATYKISAFLTANTVTLVKLDPGTAWTGAAAGTCHYTVWEAGTFGAEAATCAAFNGFGKDNTQDVQNILYELFYTKTILSESVESMKVACGYLGPAGSAGASIYFSDLPKASTGYTPGIPQGTALPGSPLANGDQLLLGLADFLADGTNGRPDSRPTDRTVWGGVSGSTTPGWFLDVDFGTDVEIGSVILRVVTASEAGYTNTDTVATAGLIGNLHRALSAGGAPAAASVARCSGTGAALVIGSTTVSLTADDFLDTEAVSGNTATTTTGGATIQSSAAGNFTGREGQVVRLTSGVDAGYYRIVSVNGGGDTATVRKLDQSTPSFAAASGLSFSIYANAVREDDILVVPSGGTHKMTVERLLSPTSAQVRITPTANLSGQTWQALTPTWALVKRLAHSVQATAPNVANNGTYVSGDGRERAGAATEFSCKLVFDLTDLTTAQRTGRYWRFSAMPRFSGVVSVSPGSAHAVEFYDTTGKRIDLLPNNKIDTVDTEANYIGCHVMRIDWIQSANTAFSDVAGHNGLATIGGTNNDAVTLAGGNKWIGFRVRTGTGITAVGGDATFTKGGGDPGFIASDAGRLLRVAAGANQGYYRIASVIDASNVSVTTPGGSPVTLAASTAAAFTVHEGIGFGASNYDYLYISGKEIPILAVSDDLATLTLGERFNTAAAATWEIRRRAVPQGTPNGTPVGVDATKSARILYGTNEWSRQSGDFVQDAKGSIGVGSGDVGTPITRADGSITGGSGVFTGTAFTADDVDRILVITTGANVGRYRVSVFTSATSITVVNASTGAAVSLTADAGPVSYKLVGERRFRVSRYVTAVRY